MNRARGRVLLRKQPFSSVVAFTAASLLLSLMVDLRPANISFFTSGLAGLLHPSVSSMPWPKFNLFDPEIRRAKCDKCSDVRVLDFEDCKEYVKRGLKGGIVCRLNGCDGIMWLLKDPRE
jgi:hypothetical protein